ncbi:MAG: arginine--tRNA ligase [Patescibacteria group bacterium]|nr:arginine--tRNA ligase [Patescibacteria group bacterium]
MKEQLLKILVRAVAWLDVEPSSVHLDYPEDPAHGDLSTNVAMANAKALNISPRALAEKIVAEFEKAAPDFVAKVEIAGPGFINFTLKDEAIARAVVRFSDAAKPEPATAAPKVMVEYTDPNICKVFHVGHLMANAIGESLSRLIEFSGNEVIRACYPSDVGLNVAKTVAAILKSDKADMPAESAEPRKKAEYLGKMYVVGTKMYDESDDLKSFVIETNKKIFARSDKEVSDLYDTCRKWSLEYFELIYARLGTKFNVTIYESDVAEPGMKIVRQFLGKGVFSESDGAVVFKGEDHGLHTRVFITSQGLPTYESKEVGLNVKKFQLYPDLAESIVVTANEQDDYFKVLLKAMFLVRPDIAGKTKHLSHGLLRSVAGKMSSRTGQVMAAETLIDEIKDMVKEKIQSSKLKAQNSNQERDFSGHDLEEIADQVAIAAIKYTILRQGIGGDVIFDSAKSISFEGDSGPYLQYSAVRAKSVLEKSKVKNQKSKVETYPEKVGILERLIIRFPDIVERARTEYAPQVVAGYLISLASAFNSFYAGNTIVDEKEPLSPYRVALTRAFRDVMTEGLWLLGIEVPRKM